MRLLSIVLIAGLLITSTSEAQTFVHGHYRKDGTYVQPHYRTKPDNNPYNNYSAEGNENPYTGTRGRVAPYEGKLLRPATRTMESRPAVVPIRGTDE